MKLQEILFINPLGATYFLFISVIKRFDKVSHHQNCHDNEVCLCPAVFLVIFQPICQIKQISITRILSLYFFHETH